MAQKSFKRNILTNCAYSVIGGFGLQAFTPMFDSVNDSITTTIIIALKGAGIFGLAYYAMTWSRFDKLFENLGLGVNGAYPILKDKRKTEFSTIYKFTLPSGLSLSDFDKCKEAIEQHLGRDIDIKYTYKEIYIEVYKENLKMFYEYIPTKIRGNVPIVIGYNRHGELISCDLADDTQPHLGVYGETGSGKSTIIRAIITNLILMSGVNIHLVDLKNGAEFGLFRKSSKVKSFCRSVKETEDLLMQISIEVDLRYDLFYEKDVKDIKEYNKKFKNKQMDYQVIIIDEFADIPTKSKCMYTLKEIGRKARACGIHLILATQRPSANILDGDIKANITSVLGLKTNDRINSQVVIDEVGLEKLRGKGHGIFKRGNKVEIQAPFLDPDRARELIKHTFIDKPMNKVVKNGNVSENSVLEALNIL